MDTKKKIGKKYFFQVCGILSDMNNFEGFFCDLSLVKLFNIADKQKMLQHD